MTVRGRTTMEVVVPLARAAVSAVARPMPTSRPITDAMMPVMTASVRTDRLICLRLAPMARSRASSLVRWATTMPKML